MLSAYVGSNPTTLIMKAIVDVDNTLCDYAPMFYDELCQVNPAIPHYTQWNMWDFYDGYMTKNEFYDCAHMAQMRISECKPINYAEHMLSVLSEHFIIVIASHRKEESRDELVSWLEQNNMVYNSLDISNDKTKLFDRSTSVVIDDSPIVLTDAYKRGILAAGLSFPWNRHMSEYGIFLGEDLLDVTEHVHP